MDYNKAALEMHETHKGKVGIVSKVEVKTRDDLSTAYTPGVAEPCRKIKENPEDVYKYTFKGNMVAVVSNGTAVLGLGDIGPEAGLPVMEGKAVLFKEFGGVDAFPICIDAHDAASVIAACKAIAPTFGGINLEDIKSPEWSGNWTSPSSTMTSMAPPSWLPRPSSTPCAWWARRWRMCTSC